MNNYVITREEDTNIRVDKLLTNILENKSRQYVTELFNQNLVLVNDKEVKKSYKTCLNDKISYGALEDKKLDLTPINMHLNIVYEDDDVCVVYKPVGMVVHPSASYFGPTLVHGLLYQVNHLSRINGVLRPGIVHRIDKDTSGLLMVAKSDVAQASLSAQLKEHSVKRVYYALVHGVISEESARITAPIGRDKNDRKKMAVVENGKDAVTNLTVIERFKDYTFIKCILETGRTHQIRVHLNYIGHPLVGDPTYGHKRDDQTNGQFLHAAVIGFVHPVTKKYMEFESELPEYFKTFLEELQNYNN